MYKLYRYSILSLCNLALFLLEWNKIHYLRTYHHIISIIQESSNLPVQFALKWIVSAREGIHSFIRNLPYSCAAPLKTQISRATCSNAFAKWCTLNIRNVQYVPPLSKSSIVARFWRLKKIGLFPSSVPELKSGAD